MIVSSYKGRLEHYFYYKLENTEEFENLKHKPRCSLSETSVAFLPSKEF
jgi:hypothetical protein